MHGSSRPLVPEICFRYHARKWEIRNRKNVTDGGLPQRNSVPPCLYILHTVRSHVLFLPRALQNLFKDSIVKQPT